MTAPTNNEKLYHSIGEIAAIEGWTIQRLIEQVRQIDFNTSELEAIAVRAYYAANED